MSAGICLLAWRFISTDKCCRESLKQTKFNTRTSIRSWFFHFDCSEKCVPSIFIIGSAEMTTTLKEKLLPCKLLQAFQFDKVNICWAASQNTSEAHNNVHIGFTLLELLLMVHTSCRFVGKKESETTKPKLKSIYLVKGICSTFNISDFKFTNLLEKQRNLFRVKEWTEIENGAAMISFSKPIITSPSCLYKYETNQYSCSLSFLDSVLISLRLVRRNCDFLYGN